MLPSFCDGASGGAGKRKREDAVDAGYLTGGGDAGSYLIDPGDGTSADRAEFPPAELFTARNFPVRLPRRKGKRRKGGREEDGDEKTDPGTVEGSSAGQDSWVLPVTGDGFPMTPYQDVIKAGERNVDCPYRSRGAGENLYRCAMGYAALAGVTGGLGKPVYVVTSDVDRAEDVPQGTLRWGLSNYPEGVIIRFNSSMFIRLQKRLFLQSHVTIDGRGANVIIRGGMVLQNITNVIIHNVAIGDQRGDHDVVHIAGTTRVWIDHCQVYKALRGTVDAVYGSTDITISNSYISNRNLTMLLGAEDDGVYDVDMRVTLYRNWLDKSGQRQPKARWGRGESTWPSTWQTASLLLTAPVQLPLQPYLTFSPPFSFSHTYFPSYAHPYSNLTMLLGAEDDGVYDVDMRVTLYRNWFDKSGQRQPKARWGRVHVANSLYSKWSYYCLGGRMYAAIRSDRNIFIAGDARKELTPWFGERALWTEGFDTTPVIRSFGDLLVNGATFTEFNADLSIFDPPYRLPMHTADRELAHFIRVNAGPRNGDVPELLCTPQTCFQ
ncbi:unnamed protein product [Closterium sp. Yama58-4]|nr:unnamed protein product [Closterium sp. Yama58-4]